MAFGSFFQAQLVQPLVFQLMGVLQRDFTSSLATVNAALPGIQEWDIGFFPVQNWPALMLAVRDEKFTRPADVQARAQEVSLEITIALSNQDRNVLSLQAYQYILAVDKIISSLGAQVNASITPNFGDFYTPLPLVIPFPQRVAQSPINLTTTGMQTGSVLGCWPTSINYSDLMKTTNALEMLVSENFVINVEEV